LLGNETPEFLAIAEVRLDEDLYARPGTPLRHRKMICPKDLSPPTADEIRGMTRAVFEALGCRDLARADFMMDAAGKPSFLEINPLPSLSPAKAVFPLQARVSGLSYEDMIGRIIEVAEERSR
jgi:D-alanine-D-alanine ligase